MAKPKLSMSLVPMVGLLRDRIEETVTEAVVVTMVAAVVVVAETVMVVGTVVDLVAAVDLDVISVVKKATWRGIVPAEEVDMEVVVAVVLAIPVERLAIWLETALRRAVEVAAGVVVVHVTPVVTMATSQGIVPAVATAEADTVAEVEDSLLEEAAAAVVAAATIVVEQGISPGNALSSPPEIRCG